MLFDLLTGDRIYSRELGFLELVTINDAVIAGVIMVFALMFHNVLQAWIAMKLGDRTPANSGSLSFDPQRQLNAMGTGLLLVLGLGWPNMVPINSRNYKGKGKGEALAWYAGPLAYLIIAFVCIFISVLCSKLNADAVSRSFWYVASIAIFHAVINLFPVYPLDGAKAALAWGNRDVRKVIQQIYGFGIMGFMVIFFLLGGIMRAIEAPFFTLFFSVSEAILGIFF